MRAGEFFALQTADPKTARDASYHATLGRNFFRDGETIEVRYAVNAAGAGLARVSAALLNDGVGISRPRRRGLPPWTYDGGTLRLRSAILVGRLYLRVTFQDKHGNAVSKYADDVFVLNEGEMKEPRRPFCLRRPGDARRLASEPGDPVDWLDEFIKRPNYEDIRLNDWWDDIVNLTSGLERTESRPSSAPTSSSGMPTGRPSTTPCSPTRSSCRRASMPARSIRSSSPCTAAASTNRPRCKGTPRPPACWDIR